MGYQGKERGTRNPLSRRVGRDFEAFGGEVSEFDAATVGLGDFVSAVNADVNPERVTPRPGEAKILASPLDADVKGIWDLESWLGSGGTPAPPTPGLLATLHLAPGNVTTTAASDAFVVYPGLFADIVGTSAPSYSCIGYWEDENKIVFGTYRNAAGNVEIRGYQASPVTGAEPALICSLAVAGAASDNRVTGIAAGSDGKLYFGVCEIGATTKVYSWDGATVTLERDSGFTGKEAYVYAINDSTNSNFKIVVAYQGVGSPVSVDHLTIGGAWARKNYVFGNAGTSNWGAGCVYHLDNSDYDMLALSWQWTVGGTHHLMNYLIDPVDMSVWSSREITGSGTGETFIGVAPSNGLLYVAWGATHLGSRWISVFEDGGPGWTDEYSSIDINVASQTPIALRSDTDGNVYFWGFFDYKVYVSQGTDLTLPFTELGATSAIFNTHQSNSVMGP